MANWGMMIWIAWIETNCMNEFHDNSVYLHVGEFFVDIKTWKYFHTLPATQSGIHYVSIQFVDLVFLSILLIDRNEETIVKFNSLAWGFSRWKIETSSKWTFLSIWSHRTIPMNSEKERKSPRKISELAAEEERPNNHTIHKYQNHQNKFYTI